MADHGLCADGRRSRVRVRGSWVACCAHAAHTHRCTRSRAHRAHRRRRPSRAARRSSRHRYRGLSCRRFATSTFSARNAVTTCQQRASISTERQAVERAGAGERLGGRRRAHQRRHIQLEPQARSSCPVPPPERRRERQVGQAGEPQPGITSSYQMGAATGMWGATQGGRRLQGTLWVARASAKALAHRRRPRPNVVDRRPPPLQTQCPEALSQLRALSAARFPIGHHRQAVAGREASKNAASEQAVEWGSPARSGCRAGCGVAGSRRENLGIR